MIARGGLMLMFNINIIIEVCGALIRARVKAHLHIYRGDADYRRKRTVDW